MSPKYLMGIIDQPNDSSAINLFKTLTQEEKKEMFIICQKWLFLEYQIEL